MQCGGECSVDRKCSVQGQKCSMGGKSCQMVAKEVDGVKREQEAARDIHWSWSRGSENHVIDVGFNLNINNIFSV